MCRVLWGVMKLKEKCTLSYVHMLGGFLTSQQNILCTTHNKKVFCIKKSHYQFLSFSVYLFE